MPRGMFAKFGTAELIKQYLMVKKSGTPFQIWKFVMRWCGYKNHRFGQPLLRGRYIPPTYDSIRSMIFAMRDPKNGGADPLVVEVRREAVSFYPGREEQRLPESRRFYAIAPGKESDIRWRDPKKAYYDPLAFERVKDLPRATPSQDDIEAISELITREGL